MPDVDRLYDWFSEATQLSSEEQAAFLESRRESEPTMADQLRKLLSPPPVIAEKLERFFCAQDSDCDAPDTSGAGEHGPTRNLGTIDRFQILELLGEGGMGVVYKAQQLEPVQRQVALKIIKPGMNSQQVLQRFEVERRTLALMDHHGIARVLDAGKTYEGHPFFAMELVEGQPLTTYCQTHAVPLRDRLALMIDICRAVQHAHQKGVIHRDLKPSNLLVTDQDNRPTTKVIDFGIAKALEQPSSESTSLTQGRQLMGTPLYMSPEQARLDNLDVDTRSDVFSLGVVLYELVTATLPIERTTLQDEGLEEFCRRLRDEIPLRPSQRLRSESSGDSRPPAAGSLRSLSDLDWIVMRAIERDRERRYDSPSDLADDLQRYLNGEAVEAHPPTIGYRASMWAKRHRGSLAAAVSIIAALSIGIFGTTQQMLAAKDQAKRATRAEELAKNRTNDLESALEESRQVNLFWGTQISLLVIENQKKDVEGISAAEFLQSVERRAREKFAQQPLVLANILYPLARGFKRLYSYDHALELFREAESKFEKFREPYSEEALSVRFQILDTRSARRDYTSDEWWQTVRQLYQDSLEHLGPDNPVTISALTKFSAGARTRETPEIARSLADTLVQTCNTVHGPDSYEYGTALVNRGMLERRLQNPEAAERFYRQAIQILANIDDQTIIELETFLQSKELLAQNLLATSRREEGLKLWLEVLEGRKGYLKPNSPRLLRIYESLGKLWLDTEPQRTIELLEEAIELAGSSLAEFPGPAGDLYATLARAYDKVDDDNTSLHYRELRRELLLATEEDGSEVINANLNNLAVSYGRAGRNDEAIEIYKMLIPRLKQKFGAASAPHLITRSNLAAVLLAVDRISEAEAMMLESLAICRDQLPLGDAKAHGSMGRLAQIRERQGRWFEAAELRKEVFKSLDQQESLDSSRRCQAAVKWIFNEYQLDNQLDLKLLEEVHEIEQRLRPEQITAQETKILKTMIDARQRINANDVTVDLVTDLNANWLEYFETNDKQFSFSDAWTRALAKLLGHAHEQLGHRVEAQKWQDLETSLK